MHFVNITNAFMAYAVKKLAITNASVMPVGVVNFVTSILTSVKIINASMVNVSMESTHMNAIAIWAGKVSFVM